MKFERESSQITLTRDWGADEITLLDVDKTGAETKLTFSVFDAETLGQHLLDISK